MHLGDIINGYTILEEPKVVGGMSIISFASKGDEVFFIKEFLAPKYPLPDSPGSEKMKEKKRNECLAFEEHHKQLIDKIDQRVERGGNIVKTIDFFRWGTCYYKITDRIDMVPMTCEEISKMPLENILIIVKSVCHSIRTLHHLKIVHGDLKPDNILIKKTETNDYTAKIIDFDDYFFSANPPKDRGKIVGSPEYYSPEQANYILDEEMKVDGKTLTCKSDIFSLGIIFYEFFTGKKPFSSYSYVAITKRETIEYPHNIPLSVQEIINQMLKLEANERPTINDVFEKFKRVKPDDPCDSSLIIKINSEKEKENTGPLIINFPK